MGVAIFTYILDADGDLGGLGLAVTWSEQAVVGRV